jgi:hypothetical protein
MSDVLELGHRITVALDRIRRGMEAQDKADAAETSLFDALRAEQAQTGALRVQIQQLQDALDAGCIRIDHELFNVDAGGRH